MADLEIRGLKKVFGGIHALDNVDFSASIGEIHALLGENGAGKSTLIKILTGALHADSGEISLFGQHIQIRTPRQARAAGIGAVFQELSLIPDLTVAQNVWFRREPRTPIGSISSRALKRQTRQLFTDLGLPYIDPEREARTLSVAHRQLVEIAKVVSQRPRVLILDEATSALSPREVSWLLELCRRLASEGTLVIFITHRLVEVRQVADTVTVFRNGKRVGTAPMRELSDDQIIGMMVGGARESLYPERQSIASDRVMLRVTDLRFGDRLQGASFEVREGEILGVGGLQGQGQAELLLALYGMLPARGTIEIDGKVWRIRNPRDALQAGVGMALVPEDRRNQGLLLTKSIKENISLPMLSRISHVGFLQPTLERAIATRAVQQLNIVSRSLDQYVNRLSGGNQQKVVIAKLLQTDAKILLLYDLTRGVDVGAKADIFQLMRDLTGRGYTILFYSTDLQELIHVADRIIVLHDGRVNATLTSETMTEENIIRASFTTDASAVQSSGVADREARGEPSTPTRSGMRAVRSLLPQLGALPISLIVPFLMLVTLLAIYASKQTGVFALGQLNITTSETLTLIFIGVAQTLVILTGGIDLSVGGITSLATTVAALYLGNGTLHVASVIIAMLLGGSILGALNGVVIAFTRMQPFIVTLATWSVWGGAALLVLSTPGGSVPLSLVTFGTNTYLGVATPVWLLGVLLVLWLYFKRTRTGVTLRAVGSSQEAAYLSGISVPTVLITAYALSGLFSTIAGLYLVTQTTSGSPVVGNDYILPSVAAVVIGGTTLLGGRGGLVGTVLGAFILTLIGSVVFVYGLSSAWQTILQGLLLIVAVLAGAVVSMILGRRYAFQ
jgi:ribose transport system ATP-binding protein